MQNIISQFEQHFDIVPANSDHLLCKCQELRYQIFCREQHIFDEHASGDHLEIDEYDQRSVHALLRYKKTGDYAATVRIVLPEADNEMSFYPLDKHILAFSYKEYEVIGSMPRANLAEISRFSVSKSFRRRVGEKNLLHGVSKQFGKNLEAEPHRRFDAYITLGLFKAIVQMSASHDINNWLAFMEPGLIRLLRRVGIVFHRVGPVIDYCGIRHACYADGYQVLQGIKAVRPEFWDFITDHGKYDFQSNVTKSQLAEVG